MNSIPVEEVWKRVRRWAKRHGHEYVSTYGVVGVAPTLGHVIGFWFRKLRIKHNGPIYLDQDENGNWIATYNRS